MSARTRSATCWDWIVLAVVLIPTWLWARPGALGVLGLWAMLILWERKSASQAVRWMLHGDEEEQ